MSKNRWDEIQEWHQSFMEEQAMFFVATAAQDGLVNMAPKDTPSLKVMGPNRIVWVNLTGAENETGAHLVEPARMTLMWCSFGKKPMILRAYGTAEIIHPRDPAWSNLIDLFPTRHGSRQLIDMTVELVLKSCGYGVPIYDLVSQRDTLKLWEERKGKMAFANIGSSTIRSASTVSQPSYLKIPASVRPWPTRDIVTAELAPSGRARLRSSRQEQDRRAAPMAVF